MKIVIDKHEDEKCAVNINLSEPDDETKNENKYNVRSL